MLYKLKTSLTLVPFQIDRLLDIEAIYIPLPYFANIQVYK